MTMTKAHLVERVYESQDLLTKAQAAQIVESFLGIAKSSLANGDNLLISGFGKFSVKNKNERRGRNPQTGEDLMLSARRVVTFKPSGSLREKLNNGG